jgi:hypothetical protein
MRMYHTGDGQYVNLDRVERVGIMNAGGKFHVVLWFGPEDIMVLDSTWDEEGAHALLRARVQEMEGPADAPAG